MNHEEFFDSLAHSWDETTKHDKEKIKEIVEIIGFTNRAKVLDVGSGTGILIPFIIPKIGRRGRIVCVDVSDKMLKIASKKFPTKNFPNLEFIHSDILNYETDELFDFIVCYSSFPHFTDKRRSIKKMSGFLKQNGKLVIAHSQSRREINDFHSSYGDPISNDFLPTSQELASIFKNFSLNTTLTIDDETKYLVIGTKSY